jgi:hypothetical protein
MDVPHDTTDSWCDNGMPAGVGDYISGNLHTSLNCVNISRGSFQTDIGFRFIGEYHRVFLAVLMTCVFAVGVPISITAMRVLHMFTVDLPMIVRAM